MKKKSAFESVRRNFHQDGFFRLRVLSGILLCFAGVTLVLALGKASAQPRTPAVQTKMPLGGFAAANKIAPWVMEHTANGQQAEFFVVLADQADLSPAANLTTKAEKGRFVYQALQNKAQTTQGSILQWLRERGLEHRSFYIVNAILVKGTLQVAEALAARPDVARVEGNPHIQNQLPQPGPSVEAPLYLQQPDTIEPGINYTHAPQVWALGFTGQTIVIASADTGVRWTHNALKPHYRGWDGVNADHDYNWHDSIHSGGGDLAVLTRLSRAMISSTVPTPPAQPLAMTAPVTRSAWPRVQNGLVAVTWTKVTAPRPHTWSACNGSWRLPGSTATTPTRPKHRTLRSIPGVVPLQKAARLTRCKLLSKPRLLLAL